MLDGWKIEYWRRVSLPVQLPRETWCSMNFLDSFSPRWNISLFHNKPIGWGRHERAGQDQVREQNMAYFKTRAQVLGHEYVLVSEDTVFKLLCLSLKL
ncbi:hypothetical protein Bca52824_077201 [Brassica carinata]|uniref:Uncharacterized protein n=1 Tax=Brassica carinata TaxID=52824 RepID=A0A8X7PW98_BRACI|nr:hypothetical protein Bca52824_077201 [Brassica carinata]